MIRSPKGIMVVEDFQQVLLDSSLNPNSFASTSPAVLHNWDLEQGGNSQPLFQMLQAQAKITQIKHIWFIFKRKSCYFSYKRKPFLSEISPDTRVVVFLHFLVVSLWTQNAKACESKRDQLCKAEHSTAPLQQTNGKKYAVAVLQNWLKKKKKCNSLIYATLLGSRLQSVLSGKHKLTVPLDTADDTLLAAPQRLKFQQDLDGEGLE